MILVHTIFKHTVFKKDRKSAKNAFFFGKNVLNWLIHILFIRRH